MLITLPNELLIKIGNYVYSQKHSNFYVASKTTKSIMDSLAKKQNYENYLSKSLVAANRCHDCHKRLPNYEDFFFEKKYKLCRSCAYDRPKISPTEIKKNYLLKEQDILDFDLPSISYKNKYRVWCSLYLETDIEKLQNFLYTQEQINSFYERKEKRLDRKEELEEARNSRKLEINKILSKFSNSVKNCVIDNSSECEKYIHSGVPKNAKKKQELVERLLAEAEDLKRRRNYAKNCGSFHEKSKKRASPNKDYYY